MSKRCVNGQLGPSVTSSLFTITVSAPQLLEDQLPLEASGVVGAAGIWGGFIVGPGITGPQTFCPLTPASSCPPGIQTVFDGTSMDVQVPGGQAVYIAANGALSISTPHSALFPPGSLLSGFGPSGGEFVYTGGPGTFAGSGWIGCPVPVQDFSPPLNFILQIFANISTHPTRSASGVPFVCEDVTLLLDLYTGGFGAWQYD
ncbi:MAG: hypothetical protein MMC33_009581 [Icmadophila ericetorum]|nr:hypothetical protein [Icmadophila ericetorum]